MRREMPGKTEVRLYVSQAVRVSLTFLYISVPSNSETWSLALEAGSQKMQRESQKAIPVNEKRTACTV